MVNSVFVNTQGLYQRRRAFNMSYRNDYTCCLGELIPVYWQDLLPNSSWHCRAYGLIRFLPMVAPIMDNIDYYIHFWQAPRRILEGEEFTQMITGELEAEDWPGIYFIPQQINLLLEDALETGTGYLVGNGSIFDMLGYDLTLFNYSGDGSLGKLNARKFIMYIRLLRNWYTNENIEPYEGFLSGTEAFDKLDYLATYDDGDISALIVDFLVGVYTQFGTAGYIGHAWPKDYLTSALPTLQYGLPTYLPLADSAPVTIDHSQLVTLFGQAPNGLEVQAHDVFGTSGELGELLVKVASDGKTGLLTADGAVGAEVVQKITGHLRKGDGSTATDIEGTADLSEATAITINELRIANALQVFKEREMRFGRKAPEYYKGFYGVSPGDLRLQLPKFLGGGRLAVNVSDVEQTAGYKSDNTDMPLGTLAGKGTAVGAFAKASTFTAEEALVLGVAWLMPKVTYAQCLSRHDTKLNDRFDYYNPSFAHIGEQEVFNYEAFAGTYGTPTGSREFGYQPRYTEYRFHMNEMHGDFKGSLSYWTLGRIFDSQPALNADFIYMQPLALNRVFASVQDSSNHPVRNVLASIQFVVSVIQPLSRYGTPGLMP